MTREIRRWRIATSYGYVSVVGRCGPLVGAVIKELRDGRTLAESAGASVERLIARAEGMNQKAELN